MHKETISCLILNKNDVSELSPATIEKKMNFKIEYYIQSLIFYWGGPLVSRITGSENPPLRKQRKISPTLKQTLLLLT